MKKRICPQCNHSSPASTMTCPSCNASLANVTPVNVDEPTAKERAENLKPSKTVRRCHSCGTPITSHSPYCSKCGAQLNAQSQSKIQYNDSSESNVGVYVLSILVPLAGIIIGAIKIGNNTDRDTGKMCIILSVCSSVVCGLIAALIYSSLL